MANVSRWLHPGAKRLRSGMDADFDRIEVIGDLIRHIEIVYNERRQHQTKVERLAK